MSTSLLVNLAWAMTAWMAAGAAAVVLMRRCPATARRTVCRAVLAGLPLALVGAVAIHVWRPDFGLIPWPRDAEVRAAAPAAGDRTVERTEPYVPSLGGTAGLPAVVKHAETHSTARTGRATRPVTAPEAGRKMNAETRAAAPAPPATASAAAVPAVSPGRSVNWGTLALVFWLLGAVGLMLHALLDVARLMWWARSWKEAPPAWGSVTQRLARRVGLTRPFRVFVAPGLCQPAAAGVARAAIVLPAEFEIRPGPAMRGVLSHELGHVAGRDPLWRFLWRVGVALTWWCPLSWWLRRRADVENELTADDHALSAGARPEDLANTLVRFAEMCCRPLPATISGMASHLTRRIEMILNDRQPHAPRIERRWQWGLALAGALVCAAVVLLPLVGTALAAEGEREGERVAQRGTDRVRFVRLIEVKVGDREQPALVVAPLRGDRTVTLLLPREGDLLKTAKTLKAGQVIAVSHVMEREQRWVTKIEVVREGEGDRVEGERREGDRPAGERTDREGGGDRVEGERREAERREADRPKTERTEGERREAERREADRPKTERTEGEQREGEAREGNVDQMSPDELRAAVRRNQERLEKLERELRALREENAALRKRAQEGRRTEGERTEGERREGERTEGERREGERREGERAREEAARAEGGLPAALRGFRGMMRGEVVSKGERSLVLKIQEVGKLWPKNTAEHPQEAVGSTVRVTLPVEGDRGKRFLDTFEAIRPGDTVVLGAMHTEGNSLVIVEDLERR